MLALVTFALVRNTIKSMKKLVVGIIAVVAVIVVAFVGFVGFMQWVDADSVTGDDGVAAGYSAETGGPLEASFAGEGPHEVDVRRDGDVTIAAPTGAGPFPAVVMANGTNTPLSSYLPVAEHLASWGFVVVGDETPHTGTGENVVHLIERLPDLESRVDRSRVGIFGHSQGGAGAINAAAHADVAAVYAASPASHKVAQSNDWDYTTANVKAPLFLMTSDGRSDRWLVSPWSDLQESFESAGGPAVIARRLGADHKDVLEFGDGYATAWFRYILADDPDARDVFVGTSPAGAGELANNDLWDRVATRGW